MDKTEKPTNVRKTSYAKVPIICMMLFLSLIVISSIYKEILPNKSEDKPKASDPTTVPATATPAASNNEGSMLAVVKEVDSDLYVITLVDAESGETDMYTYTGATDVRSKYGIIISAKQLRKGDMVDVIYDMVSKKVSGIRVSSSEDVFVYSGMQALLFNTKKNIITLLGSRYIYDDSLIVMEDGKEITINGFNKKDVFTVRGYGHKICSIELTRGHGYLRLADDEKFIGGNIYVGTRIWQQITDGMVVEVPEGTYDVTVEHKDYNGTQKLRIERYETTLFYVGGYAPQALSVGRVYFSIYPEGAALYIDNAVKSFDKAIELTYGIHTVEVSMGGYKSYVGNITIDKTETHYTVALSESPNNGNNSPVDPYGDGDNNGNGDNNGDSDGDGDNDDDDNDNGNGNNDGDGDGDDDGDGDNDSTLTEDTDPNGMEGPDYAPTPTPTDGQNNGNTSTDNTSEVRLRVDYDHTIVIKCTNGVEVYFDGTYVGEIIGGSLVIPKYIGNFEVDLYLEGYDVASYTLEVANDHEDVEITLPGF